MRLVKGSWDRLKGSVVIYSVFTSKNPNQQGNSRQTDAGDGIESRIFAEYATIDPTRFMDRTGAPPEFIDDAVKKNAELRAAGQKLSQDLGAHLNLIHLYNAIVDVGSEEELFRWDQEDVLFAGRYSSPSNCADANILGLRVYLLQLSEQLGVATSSEPSGEQKKGDVVGVRYKDIGSDDLQAYIMQNYVVPMIDSVNFGDIRTFGNIRQGFVEFSTGSFIANDVLRLCEEVWQHPKAQRTELISAYVNKMVALGKEDYKTAAIERDRIAELSQQG